MIAVQLPTGEIRTALNLLDNPTNLNKWVKVNGTLEGYFSGTPGVKNATEYLLESIGTSTAKLSLMTDLRAANGNVSFNATANQTVEIFNSVGQRLVSRTTVEGLNTISVNAKGILVVKLGNDISKVMM